MPSACRGKSTRCAPQWVSRWREPKRRCREWALWRAVCFRKAHSHRQTARSFPRRPGHETAHELARIGCRNVPWSAAVAAHHLAFPRDRRAAPVAEQCQPARDGRDARVRERGEPVVEGAEDCRRPPRAVRGDPQRRRLPALPCRGCRHHAACATRASSSTKPEPNLEIVRAGFRDARNHPADIESMIDLFRRFRNVGFMATAITIWTRADAQIAELEADRARAACGDRDRQGATRRSAGARLPRRGRSTVS